MIVVSDTSPLNYLILVDCIDVLPQVFGQVYVPSQGTRLANPILHALVRSP